MRLLGCALASAFRVLSAQTHDGTDVYQVSSRARDALLDGRLGLDACPPR